MDEAAFLNAILAAPADSAPRLAYADWLDERGDLVSAAKAAFLRGAEGPAADAPALRRLAAGLDPAWLAAVSRLPVDDVFATCNEASVPPWRRGTSPFEWDARAELAPGRVVGLDITWYPEDGVPLASVVAAARAAWDRLRGAEEAHRRAAVAELNGPRPRWPIRPEDLYPTSVSFLPDGSVEISYGGIGSEHPFVVAVSPEGQYLGLGAR
jgi:uncharacterized protein (TIGR02996 family)